MIVDVAHHLRNTDTFLYEGVRFLCELAEAVVFLTATPIQLGSADLFVLLNLLRPDLILDSASFEYITTPNPHINRAIELARAASPDWQKDTVAALTQAEGTEWGQAVLRVDPEFNELRNALENKKLNHQERISCIRDMEQLHTVSGFINRTRRRDIGAFTTRKPETVTVEFTPQQKQLHDDLLNTQAAILRILHGNQNVQFLMTTIRRQAASCLYGLAPFLRDILTRRLDEIMLEEADEDFIQFDGSLLSNIEDQINHILAQAEELDPLDPKLEALLNVIKDKQERVNNKAMLFSSFRHTLRYLFDNLNRAGLRVGLIHGGTADEDRRELRRRFGLPKEDAMAIDVLLSSEVGCEGLDYQFCDCLMNYDLPWNPMRIEQRIGRIDRYGQKSETVAIYNFITPGTVDADIYQRCLMRIGIFRRSLG